MGRKSKVPWTDAIVVQLITLYGQNIDAFLSQHKNQKNLWVKLVELMKEDENLPQNVRENLTHLNAQSKWNSLIRTFKSLFYQSLDSSLTSNLVSFPFFDQMYNLFTNYASRYLNKSFQDESLQNEPIDPDVSAFVLNLLNRTQNETDIKKECNFSQKVSRAEKIVEKLKKMPSSSVSYYKQTLKIQKNTPFRRVYGLSTIVDQRNALKRKSDNDMWPVNIKTLKTSNETQEKPNLDSFDYEVEALDECIFVDQSEISEISNSYHTSSYDSSAPVYVSQQPNTILEVSDKSTSSKSNISQNIKLPKGITMKKVEPKIIVKTSLQEILKKTKKNESSSKSASLSDHSILDVPSIDSSFDENRGPLNSPQSHQLPFDYDSAATHRALVPKKLSFSLDEPGEVLEEKPPSWFTKFVERYEANSKKVNEELEKINQMLKSLPQKVLVSPRVTQIKRPR